MALDFPTSPTNGQQYQGYTYSSSVGAWQINSNAVAPAYMSDTPPTAPSNGTMWFNTQDATLYFYYNDGSSSQWVEARAPITSDGYYSPNYIINGAFDIWQRGTSSSTLGAYTTADRWYISGSGTITAAQETSVLPSGFKYALRLTSGAASSFGEAYQPIENINLIPLLGKTVTLSAYVRVNGTYTGVPSFELQGNTASDAISTGTWTSITYSNATTTPSSAYIRMTLTTTLATNLVGLRVRLGNSSTQPNGSIIYWSGIQLEEGNAATTFRRNANSIQGELAACQRYYQRWTQPPLRGVISTTTIANRMGMPLPTPMRNAPIVSMSGNLPIFDGTATSTVSTLGTNYTTSTLIETDMNISGTLTVGRPGIIYQGGSSYLELNAEL